MLALTAAGCGEGADTPAAPAPVATAANGAVSPAGDRHPGEIVIDDKVGKRVRTERAEDVPPTIAWVKSGAAWVPVVRIEVTGTAARREMTKLGPGGRFLETTIQAPPPK